MKKRDYTNELIELKERSDSFKIANLLIKIQEISKALDDLTNPENNVRPEVLRYIPITTVACIQSYFKEVVAKLIDFGEPYSKNVAKLNQIQNLKFDFAVITQIKQETFTLGEFVAHFLPCNNLIDFNKSLSILIQTDFLKTLKEFIPHQKQDERNSSTQIKASDFEKIFKSMDTVFKLRHIFCHEFAFDISITKEEIHQTFKDCSKFLFHVNSYISHITNPLPNINREDIKGEALKMYEKVQKELDFLTKDIVKKELEDDLSSFFSEKDFNESIKRWKEYVIAKTRSKFGKFENSPLHFLFLGFLTRATEEKIKELRKNHKNVLRADLKKKLDKESLQFKFLEEVTKEMLKD